MEAPDTFTLLELSIDPSTKAVSSSSSSLAKHLETLNSTHRGLLSLNTPDQAPPPPLPVQPQRSQQITKLRESAQAALKKPAGNPSGGSGIPANIADAIKLYTLAVDMALSRPAWEPSGLVREEAAVTLSGRAEAYALARQWADSLVDAKLSVESKPAGNVGAYVQAGRALIEMGRRSEARELMHAGQEGETTAMTAAKAQLNQLKSQIAQAQAQGQGAQIPPQALAQVKQMEAAVAKQEETMKELTALLKDNGA